MGYTKSEIKASPDSTLQPRATTPPVWFLREQFFPQTLPSIIYMQLPLDIATFLDAADYLVSGQGYKTVVSVSSPSCGLGVGSAAMRKPLEQPARYGKARVAYSPATPPLVRVEERIMTLLSSRCDCGMAPDHQLGPKPSEREDCTLHPSPLHFAQKTIRLQPGKSCNHICQCNHLPDFLHINHLKQ